MSFETTFDYTTTIAGLNEEKNRSTASLTTLTQEQAVLQSAGAYSAEPLVVTRLSQLAAEIFRENLAISNIDSVLAEIAVVNALTTEKKADLYYFYTVVEVTKQDFMARILYNHTNALNDQKIADLRADTTTPAPAKSLIAKLLYNNYPLSADKISAIMCIYRCVQ